MVLQVYGLGTITIRIRKKRTKGLGTSFETLTFAKKAKFRKKKTRKLSSCLRKFLRLDRVHVFYKHGVNFMLSKIHFLSLKYAYAILCLCDGAIRTLWEFFCKLGDKML